MSDNFFKRQHAQGIEARELRERYTFAAEAILGDLFPEQQIVVSDFSDRKSLLTPRRAGKTHVAIAYALIVACLNANCRVPIITLTLKSAKKLYWAPLAAFSKKYGLGLKYSYTDNTATLANGSIVYLGGAETKSDIEKWRGGSYKLVIIDECKSFNINIFNELIYEILEPAAGDCDGTIMIIGTPGNILDGPFYEATAPGLLDDSGDLITIDAYEPEGFWANPPTRHDVVIKPRWVRHHWTTQQNTFKPETWDNALRAKARNRWSNENPIWVREWLGQWVSSAETQVYALQSIVKNAGGPSNALCVWAPRLNEHGYNKHGLPVEHDWNYVLGMDMGFEDDFALVVVAYSPTTDKMYQVYEFKAQHLTVGGIGHVVTRTMDYFNGKIEAMVADTGGLGKTVVASLNEQFDLYIEPAEKNQKFDYIELLNSDLHAANIKIMISGELYTEMMALQFDLAGRSKKQAIRMNRLKENAHQDNHLCDAFLYTWRFCLHHFSREPDRGPEPESKEYYEDWDAVAATAAADLRDKPLDKYNEWTDDIASKEYRGTWLDALLN